MRPEPTRQAGSASSAPALRLMRWTALSTSRATSSSTSPKNQSVVTGETFYARHGDIFARVCLALALALVAGVLPDNTAAQGSALPSSVDFRSELAAARAATERRDWPAALARWKALEKAAPRG